MANYLDKNGNLQKIDRRFILSVRRNIVEDMEREFYKKLPPTYRKKFSEEKWVREQSIGRLFMTGDKDNSLYAEFFRIFYPQAMEQSLLVLHDQDESHNVVSDMFEMFRTRRKYVRNKEIADLQKSIREKERLIQNREQKINLSAYKESKSFDKEISEIMVLKSEIDDMNRRIQDLEEKDLEEMIRRMESYDGMTYEEIYKQEAKDFEKSEDNEWFSDDKPISGYIAISSKNLSLMRFNRMQGNVVISMSKLNGGSSSENEDEEIIDIAHKRNTIQEDDDEAEIVDKDDIDDPDEESADMRTQSIIAKLQNILHGCKNTEIIDDFLFRNLTHDEIREKYGFNTSGAVKSRIFRMRTNLQDRYMREMESENVLERQIPNGTVTKYYDGAEISSIKSESIYKNYEMVKRVEYFENGKIKRVTHYKNGSYDGEYSEFYENGKQSKTGVYKNGKKTGKWISYHENGKVDEIITYYDDNKKSFEVYSENGKLEQSGILENGVLVEHIENGVYTARHDNGQVKLQGNINIQRVGVWTEYDKEGNIWKKMYYKKDGSYEWEAYDKDGNVVLQGTVLTEK